MRVGGLIGMEWVMRVGQLEWGRGRYYWGGGSWGGVCCHLLNAIRYGGRFSRVFGGRSCDISGPSGLRLTFLLGLRLRLR